MIEVYPELGKVVISHNETGIVLDMETYASLVEMEDDQIVEMFA